MRRRGGMSAEVVYPPRVGSPAADDDTAGGGEPLTLAGDEALMTLLVRNLVDNALRYGGRRIVVRIETDALTVEDDGPGVADEVLARLGDRFYRPPGQSAIGSGLGLSIVQRVAHLHGLVATFARREPPARGLVVTLRRAF